MEPAPTPAPPPPDPLPAAPAARPRGVVNPAPAKRRLRVYAFDPGASVELDTAVINDAVIELPWENPWEDDLTIGPTNEYLEVIDYDFPCQTFYEPLDLNDPHLLAQDGLPLSEGRPQFHQQMVFAVAMKTILDFERALGRAVFWSQPDLYADPDLRAATKGRYYPDFIKRLRIYPHAMRAANAYYSPAKAALLFGYFQGEPDAPGLEAPWVFTALSQDIIAHETTHAILHGLRRRSVEASSPDSLAFHEGFADIVALLQHFTMRRVVEHELARTGGVLRSTNLLTGLAQQFGRATGRNGALRQALETLSEEQRASDRASYNSSVGRTGGEAAAAAQQPAKLSSEVTEPHERGGFLVAAIFDAFVTIYERRTGDLFRIAGVAPGQPLPEKLAARLAEEACKAATSIMQMCVRALDYLPPVTTTFGEYLRAIITADTDLYPDDWRKYRVAIAEAFRKRGIAVPGCLSYAPESLLWEEPELAAFEPLSMGATTLFSDALGLMQYTPRYRSPRAEDEPDKAELKTSEDRDKAKFIRYSAYRDSAVSRPNLREEAMRVVLHNQRALHQWLIGPDKGLLPEKADEATRAWEEMLGLRLDPLCLYDADRPARTLQSIRSRGHHKTVRRDGDKASRFVSELDSDGRRKPIFDVHSVRIARRRTPEGRELQQLIAQVTQRRWGFFDRAMQAEVDRGGPDALSDDVDEPDFWFRGGATIIVDLRDGKLTHIIRKRIDNEARLEEQRCFILGDEAALAMASEGSQLKLEPFCFMHGDTK